MSFLSRMRYRKNSAGTIFTRPRANLIEGSGVTLTFADDPTDDELDITIEATGGGGGGETGTEGEWSIYDPVWTVESGTNPTIGNGTKEGAFLHIGRRLYFRVHILFGSTTTAGTGNWRIGLPSGVTSKTGHSQLVHAQARELGVRRDIGTAEVLSGETSLRIWDDGTAFVWDSDTPFTWGEGDEVFISGVIEVDEDGQSIAAANVGAPKIAASTGDLSLTDSAQDVPGATLSLDRTGDWVIVGIFDFDGGTGVNLGQLNFDGVAQSGEAHANGQRVTTSQVWTVNVSSAPKTAKLVGLRSGGTGGQIRTSHTKILAFQIGGNAGAWTTYTPDWTAVTTNPDIGNGTLTGAFRLDGKTLHLRIELTMGSTTTFGSGNWRFGLPGSDVAQGHQALSAVAFDATNFYIGVGDILDGNSFFNVRQDVGVTWNATVPFTWGDGDTIAITGTIEVA